jgi:hypothetical protein
LASAEAQDNQADHFWLIKHIITRYMRLIQSVHRKRGDEALLPA